MSTIVEVKYFNSFWMKKVEESRSAAPVESEPVWPGLDWDPYGYPTFPLSAAKADTLNGEIDGNWYIEEGRIKGGFNNTMVSQGVRAYLNIENPVQDIRSSSIIYSGVYNSRTDTNQTNVFSNGEVITKTLDPAYGSIQKLFAEDTNLIIFQENKVSQALIDKDAIYSAEGGGTVTSSNLVIGQVVPYLGRFGIGKNPESFAQFGFRKYFVDPNRGSVLRLSKDGLTEISDYGMKDYFRDQLTAINSLYKTQNIAWTLTGEPDLPTAEFLIVEDLRCSVFSGSKVYGNVGGVLVDSGAIVLKIEEYTGSPAISPTPYVVTLNTAIAVRPSGVFSYDYKSKILGSWDNYNKYYTLSIQDTPRFVDEEEGYQTLSYDDSIRGWVSYFNFKPTWGFSLKGNYYTTIDTSLYQHYFELSNNYGVFYGEAYRSSIEFVVNSNPSIRKVFKTISYEGDNGWEVLSITSDLTKYNTLPNTQAADTSLRIFSYEEGLYTDTISGYPMRAGFDRKENLYVAPIKAFNQYQNDQVLNSGSTSGIKGYYLDVLMITDTSTDISGGKELWSVGTTFSQSS